MNHNQIKDALLEFYDGELTAAKATEIRSHLASCSECQAVLDEWKVTSAALFRSPLPPVESEFFVTRVMSRLNEAAQPSRVEAWSAFWKLGFAAAGLSLMLWGFLPGNGSTPTTLDTVLMADGSSSVPGSLDDFVSYTLEGHP